MNMVNKENEGKHENQFLSNYSANTTSSTQNNNTYRLSLTSNGVSSWSELPLSPKLILPIPSLPKHMEKEFEVYPLLAKTLGTDKLSTPSPNRPLGAAPSRNAPV